MVYLITLVCYLLILSVEDGISGVFMLGFLRPLKMESHKNNVSPLLYLCFYLLLNLFTKNAMHGAGQLLHWINALTALPKNLGTIRADQSSL